MSMLAMCNESLQWRTFNFFTAQQVADRLEPGQTPQAFRVLRGYLGYHR
jgi:hypothetical protein